MLQSLLHRKAISSNDYFFSELHIKIVSANNKQSIAFCSAATSMSLAPLINERLSKTWNVITNSFNNILIANSFDKNI